jgi:hypothetical protein
MASALAARARPSRKVGETLYVSYGLRLIGHVLAQFFLALPIYCLAKFGNERHQLRWIHFLTGLFRNVQPIALFAARAAPAFSVPEPMKVYLAGCPELR